MNAEIISIGTELLLGQIVNTNAQYISQQLSSMGIDVHYHSVVGDNKNRLLNLLELAHSRSDIIITTGGLGPTIDDLTKETIAEFLGLEMVPHKKCIEMIKGFFKARGRPFTHNNLKQATFPKSARIMFNDIGTAPGAIIEKGEKTYIMLPGPPYEMRYMFEKYLLSYFQNRCSKTIYSRVLRIFGMGESIVEEKIKDLLENQSNPTIAPLAEGLELILRLTVKCDRDDDPYKLIKPVEEEIRNRLGDVVYGVDNDSLEAVVVDLLKHNKKTLSVAESCTGGLVSNMITNVPGASEVFIEGIVSYSNETKNRILGVDKSILKSYGAVSAQVAEKMAFGAAQISGADVSVGVTGIAGPGGATDKKPVGLVYIAVAFEGNTHVKAFKLAGNRRTIKQAAAKHALDMIRRTLIYQNNWFL